MFDLEKAVDEWCNDVGASRLPPDAIAELKDHVYCAVDKLREQGRSEQDAFLEVTNGMGDRKALRAEFAKNSRAWCVLCRRADQISSATPSGRSETMSALKPAVVMLLQSFVWAAVIIVVARTLDGTDYKGEVIGYLTAGWAVSWLLPLVLTDFRKAMQAECAFLRRVFNLKNTRSGISA
jgi:hypothetical protein